MKDWLRIGDMKELPMGAHEPDIVLGVVLSPYDVPDAVRGFITEDEHFRIEFRYIDGEEQGKDVEAGPHVIATEGKYSGRLLAMEIDVKAIGAKSVGLSIATMLHSAWEAVAKSFGSQSKERRAIADTARRAVATREPELIQMLGSQ